MRVVAAALHNLKLGNGSSLPFVLFHLACGLALFTELSWSVVAVCAVTFWVRMFGITAGYHRYFSHRSFKTSRAFQLVLAVLGTTCIQKGVLWWAGTHRRHHRFSDEEGDAHSPVLRGFWWSHVGWILSTDSDYTDEKRVADLAKYPELRWLNDHYLVPPVLLAAGLYLGGGMAWLVWGFFVSTTLLWHATFTINSLAHVYGSRRYETGDASRNNLWLALLTMGEGWHNNHHFYMGSARQGFFWWEIDMSYYVLRALSGLGIIWDLVQPPARAFGPARADLAAAVVALRPEDVTAG